MIPAVFELPLNALRPTQLYVSSDKLRSVQYALSCGGASILSPIPVVQYEQQWLLTDGHTRALALYYRGDQRVRVCLESDSLDWPMFEICLDWCAEAQVLQVADLARRVVPHKTFEREWLQRCTNMYDALCWLHTGESAQD
jgi:hypothetical protein